jgi:hypothetical protein
VKRYRAGVPDGGTCIDTRWIVELEHDETQVDERACSASAGHEEATPQSFDDGVDS